MCTRDEGRSKVGAVKQSWWYQNYYVDGYILLRVCASRVVVVAKAY